MENKVETSFQDKLKKALIWFFYSYIWLFLILFVIDIVSKHVAAANLTVGNPVAFIPNFFYWNLIYNKGAGYGLFQNIQPDSLRRFVLIGISVVMTAVFVTYYSVRYKKLSTNSKISLMIVTAGSFGNLIDRAFYKDGAVIDFMTIKVGNFTPFGSFNFADACLVLGMIYFIIMIIIDTVKDNKKLDKLIDEKEAAKFKNIEDLQIFSQNVDENKSAETEEKPAENDENKSAEIESKNDENK